MVEPPPGTEAKGPYFFWFLISVLVHVLDVFTRISASYFNVWHPMVIVYIGLAIGCSAGRLYDSNLSFAGNFKFFLGLALIAYAIPFVNFLGSIANATGVMFLAYSLKTIIGFILVFAPVFPLYFMYIKGTKWTQKIGVIYLIFWVFVIVMGLSPQFQTEGQVMGIDPGTVFTKLGGFISEGARTTWMYVTQAPAQVGETVERMIAAGTGEVYTGRVDSASARTLGVWIKGVQAGDWVAGQPALMSGRVEVQTLGEYVPITLECLATPSLGDPIPGSPFPGSQIEVRGGEQKRVQCTFQSLQSGLYTASIKARFPFITMGYKRAYFIRDWRKRELEQQNQEPLSFLKQDWGLTTASESSAGPVLIGMGLDEMVVLGDAPVPISWGITLHNRWQGQVGRVNELFFIVPKGFTVKKANGLDVLQVRCAALPYEEREACDDTQSNIFTLPPAMLNRMKKIVDYYTLNLEVVADPRLVLKQGTDIPYTFFSLAEYSYSTEAKLLKDVKEAE